MTAHAASLPAELSHLGNRASLSQPSTAAPAACGAGVRERQAEVVVVMLHGLMRGEASMRSLARSVHLATGLECISVGYPSSSMSLSELAAVTAQRVRDACGPDAAVFAVTHSMGGVVLRHMQGLPGTGGVRWVGCCMLAPPNRGSTVSRRLLRGRRLPRPRRARGGGPGLHPRAVRRQVACAPSTVWDHCSNGVSFSSEPDLLDDHSLRHASCGERRYTCS
eukprot:CAMPEP_0114289354 /NCGR_PEP_ID=MMETSP0059-20121206/7325_1 /TAXON_ID=36894 /ORGANISM="Pyramimonas parkeae, Strain CCMP726" /LENGTH=221 /DNA_ID=CAMNT_0001410613 /DNA_START=310 /DNA_END=975 /DNA_ORIENTATION=-